MKRFTLTALVLALTTFTTVPAMAHSMKQLEGDLTKREKYFQPLDKDAPSFSLNDPDGRPVSLADFRGKVVVLHFIYASCPTECPLHADLIGRIQEMANATPTRDQVQFVTITTDPVKDTPEVLKAYGPAHGLSPRNWVFLTSGPDNPEATRELVKRFGHKFTATEEGLQVHSVVTHVINKNGRWRANFYGLKFEPASLVTYINGLANEHSPEGHPEQSLWDRIRSWF
ncbi:MAG: redoxin domain-containing protein [Alphaproteobacteria bacterium]|nr:redoxin domain-containing protein [Alphaproteobacteria bacterium]